MTRSCLRVFVRVVTTLAVATAPSALPAQSIMLGYHFQAGDTLTYLMAEHDSVETMLPGESTPKWQTTNGRTLLRMRVDAVDAATSWIDSLVLVVTTRRGKVTPRAAEMLGKPIDLRFASNGQITVKKAPPVPDEMEPYQPAGAGQVFIGLWPALPGRAIDRNGSWTDTTVERLKTKRLSGKRQVIATWRVVGDTTVDGLPAVRIEGDRQVSIQLIGDLGIEGLTMRGEFRGNGRGAYLYAPTAGRVLWYETADDYRGDVVSVGSADEIHVPQRYRSTTSLTLISAPH